MLAVLEASDTVMMLQLAAHIQATWLSGELNMVQHAVETLGCLLWNSIRLADAVQFLRMPGRQDASVFVDCYCECAMAGITVLDCGGTWIASLRGPFVQVAPGIWIPAVLEEV